MERIFSIIVICFMVFFILFMVFQIGRVYGVEHVKYVYVPVRSQDCFRAVFMCRDIECDRGKEKPAKETPDASYEEYTVTAYCCENYPHICNDGDATQTATGTTPTPGRTIAVDPKVIPYGTHVEIEGWGTYIAEDCGGAIKGNRIDIVFDTHQHALEFGVQKLNVRIVEDVE